MDLQITNKSKLKDLQRRLEAYKVKFPVAELAKRTGYQKSNISAMLKEKKPISDNFLKKVIDMYPMDHDAVWVYGNPDIDAAEKEKNMRELLKQIDEEQKVKADSTMKQLLKMIDRQMVREATLKDEYEKKLAQAQGKFEDAVRMYRSLVLKMLDLHRDFILRIKDADKNEILELSNQIDQQYHLVLYKLFHELDSTYLADHRPIGFDTDKKPDE